MRPHKSIIVLLSIIISCIFFVFCIFSFNNNVVNIFLRLKTLLAVHTGFLKFRMQKPIPTTKEAILRKS